MHLTYEQGYREGQASLIDYKGSTDNAGWIYHKLHKESQESKIRLHGILWMLHLEGLISQSRVTELALVPWHELQNSILALEAMTSDSGHAD